MTRDEKLQQWGEGPWLDEPDREEFECFGLPCLMQRAPMGNWCGYVAVLPGHPLHGKGYEAAPVDVHGGLTYSGPCHGSVCHVPRPGEPDDVWWFGFDCAHCDDLTPRLCPWDDLRGDDREYRDIEYVRENVVALAVQLEYVRENVRALATQVAP